MAGVLFWGIAHRQVVVRVQHSVEDAVVSGWSGFVVPQ